MRARAPPRCPTPPSRPPGFFPGSLAPAGYNADQLAAGVQLATGLFLMLALMGWPRAWNALTLHDAAITPVYAVVTFIVVLQANLGGWGCAVGPARGCARLPARGHTIQQHKTPACCWRGLSCKRQRLAGLQRTSAHGSWRDKHTPAAY